MNSTSPEKDFLQFLLVSIIGSAENIAIREQHDAMGILLEISVPESKMGKIIGKGGQTIQALRTLIRLMGSKRHERVNIRVLEKTEE